MSRVFFKVTWFERGHFNSCGGLTAIAAAMLQTRLADRPNVREVTVKEYTENL